MYYQCPLSSMYDQCASLQRAAAAACVPAAVSRRHRGGRHTVDTNFTNFRQCSHAPPTVQCPVSSAPPIVTVPTRGAGLLQDICAVLPQLARAPLVYSSSRAPVQGSSRRLQGSPHSDMQPLTVSPHLTLSRFFLNRFYSHIIGDSST